VARQQYENSADLAYEWGIGKMIEEAWGGWVRKLPKAYGMDFALLDDKDDDPVEFSLFGHAKGHGLLCMVEIKGARYSVRRHRDALVALQKWRTAYEWRRATGLPIYFVWGYTDDVRWYEVDGPPDIPACIRWGGRVDRNDSADKEPLVRIPVDALHPLSAVPAWVVRR
jgi:hypothetical protein